LEDIDDLWILYNILEKKDLVTSKTTREIKADIGRPESKRKTMTLTIEVTKTEFDMSLNRLRIQGIIRECPEEYGIKGSYHTFSVEPGSTLKIMKEIWQSHQLKRLTSAMKNKEPIIIVALDAESACIALTRSFKIEIKAEINPDLPGKMDAEVRVLAEKKFLRRLADTLLRFIKNSKASSNKIIIIGPGFLKEHFTQLLNSDFPDIALNIAGVKGGSSGGIAGVFEALRSGVLESLIKETRIMEEISAVEKVLEKLGSDKGDVSYGLDQVAEDAASGAVAKLLVTIDLLRSPDRRLKIEQIIKDVEQRGGEVLIISTEHEGGYKLTSLGGVATFLRYNKYGWG
jgi:protein pelota